MSENNGSHNTFKDSSGCDLLEITITEMHTSSVGYLPPVRSFNDTQATFSNEDTVFVFHCSGIYPMKWRSLMNKWRATTIELNENLRNIHKPLIILNQANTTQTLKFNVGYDNGGMIYGLKSKTGKSVALLHTGVEKPVFMQLYYKTSIISAETEKGVEILLGSLESNYSDPCRLYKAGSLHFFSNSFP